MDIPLTITCVDCGADAHLMTLPPEDGWEIGDIVAYRCAGCMDRWDLVVADPDVIRNDSDSFDFRQWISDRQHGDTR